jgi:hypothetical protein
MRIKLRISLKAYLCYIKTRTLVIVARRSTLKIRAKERAKIKIRRKNLKNILASTILETIRVTSALNLLRTRISLKPSLKTIRRTHLKALY